jgi:hypothetical protein
MKGRFPNFARVRLKADVPRGQGDWPLPGQQMTVMQNLAEGFPDEPARYCCEWDIAGTKPHNHFLEDQLEPWSE